MADGSPAVAPEDVIRRALTHSDGDPDEIDAAEAALAALVAERDALQERAERSEAVNYSWQQTAEASEEECAAWRGFSDRTVILCNAIANEKRITHDGVVYTQERWAENLKERACEIRAKFKSLAALGESAGRVEAVSAYTEQAAKLKALPEGWDSYGAKVPDPVEVDKAVEIAEALGALFSFPGDLVPTSDGMQIEFHCDGFHVECYVAAAGESKP